MWALLLPALFCGVVSAAGAALGYDAFRSMLRGPARHRAHHLRDVSFYSAIAIGAGLSSVVCTVALVATV